jgi:hypothetical protein
MDEKEPQKQSFRARVIVFLFLLESTGRCLDRHPLIICIQRIDPMHSEEEAKITVYHFSLLVYYSCSNLERRDRKLFIFNQKLHVTFHSEKFPEFFLSLRPCGWSNEFENETVIK